MSNANIKFLDAIYRFLLGAFLFLLPLLWAPFLFSPGFARTAAILGMGVLSLFYLIVRWVLLGRCSVTRTPLTFPLTLLVVVAIASAVLSQSPFVETLYGFLGELIAVFIIFTAAVESGSKLLLPVALGAAVLSVLHIESVLGLLSGYGFMRGLSGNLNFSTFNSRWISLGYLMVGLAAGVGWFLARSEGGGESEGRGKKFVIAFLTALPVAAAISIVVAMIRSPGGNNPLSPGASWIVLVEAVRKKPIFGVGPGQYAAGFTAGRPIELNESRNWQAAFTAGFSEPFTLGAELGLAGIATLVFLLFRVFTSSAAFANRGERLIHLSPLFSVLLFLALLPAGETGWVLLVVTLGGLAVRARELGLFTEDWQIGRAGSPRLTTAHLTVLLFSAVAAILLLVKVEQAVASDYWMQRSLSTGEQGKGGETYRLQGDALTSRPTNLSYRLTYASTNLRLADALIRASMQNGKPILSDENRQTVQKLLSEAIKQAKQVTADYPNRREGWEELANIYKSLINVSDGAPGLALSAFGEALQRDPTNPSLYYARGNVSFAVKNYDLAVEDYRRALSLKNDWAQAWFSLGQAYENSGGKTSYAQQAYTRAVELSAEGSEDRKAAKEALNKLTKGTASEEEENSNPDSENTPTPSKPGKLTPTPVLSTPTPTVTLTPVPTASPTGGPTATPPVPSSTVVPTSVPTLTPTPIS